MEQISSTPTLVTLREASRILFKHHRYLGGYMRFHPDEVIPGVTKGWMGYVVDLEVLTAAVQAGTFGRKRALRSGTGATSPKPEKVIRR